MLHFNLIVQVLVCWSCVVLCGSVWFWTHVSFVDCADVSADVQVSDESVALGRVDSGSEGQSGPVLRRRELHLGQIVYEEVQFGGNTAETGLDQPEEGHTVRFWLKVLVLNSKDC